MKRRGFVFTLDAILAVVLLTMFVTSILAIQSQTANVYNTYSRTQDKYIAENVLYTLRTTPLRELVPPDIISKWVEDGVLNTTLVSPDMSPVDIAATYWASASVYNNPGLKTDAEIVLGYVLNNTLKGYNYELFIDNYTSPYLRKGNSSMARDISPATLLISGYSPNQTPRGYMARAYLSKIGSKSTIYVVRGGYIYARTDNYREEVVIKYIVPPDAIPPDANVTHISWFVEPAWVGSEYSVYLNGEPIWSGYVNENRLISASATVENRLKEYFYPGRENVFEVRVYKPRYDGGEDGAQYIKIYYTTSVPSTLQFPRKFYFEDVTANYGITAWKYLFVPGLLNSLNIQIAVGNVSSSTPISLSFMFDKAVYIPPSSCSYDSSLKIKTCYWKDADIRNTLASEGYNYTQISSRYTTIIVTAGGRNTYYYPRIHLIGKESFVEADYKANVLLTKYSIDITTPISLPDQDFTNNVQIRFDVPEGVTPLWVKFQFPWLYMVNSGQPDQEISITNEKYTDVFLYKHPPNPFIYALARIGYTTDTFDYQYQPLNDAITPGENIIRISLGRGYQIQPENGEGSLTYIIQGFAGYGNVFSRLIRPGCGGYNVSYYWVGDLNTPRYILAGDSPYCDVTASDLLAGQKTYAIDDAIIRLFNKLGGDGTRAHPLLIELANSINIEVTSMGNIPTLAPPITITLRVWRGG